MNFRCKFSPFTAKLAQSQAVEFYGEWLLVPSNLTFQRVHTGQLDPTVIGDKFKVKTQAVVGRRGLTVLLFSGSLTTWTPCLSSSGTT